MLMSMTGFWMFIFSKASVYLMKCQVLVQGSCKFLWATCWTKEAKPILYILIQLLSCWLFRAEHEVLTRTAGDLVLHAQTRENELCCWIVMVALSNL